MNDLIKLVKTYRLTQGIAERLRLGEEIFRMIEADLRLFVYSSIHPPAADDVLQEVLKAVATGMGKFAGGSNEEFWGWCYAIARNKINDQLRHQSTERQRVQPMSEGELIELVDASAQVSPLCPADRHDLEYAMKLLIASKPECYDYLWKHFIFGQAYGEIAEEQSLTYDNVRMKIGRCLDEVQALVA